MGTGSTLGDQTFREERFQESREAGCVFHAMALPALLQPLSDRRHQFRRAGHVPIGVGDMSVTEIRGQDW